MLPILILVSVVLFFLMNVLPGDAATSLTTAESSQQYIEKLREEMGLNKPVYIRYLDWILGMLKGDFGDSLITGQPVVNKIKLRLPVTIELTLFAIIIAVITAVPLGIISAIKRNGPLDWLSSFFAMLGVAMPHFWLGMLLILLFSVTLRWLPASGYTSFFTDPVKNLAGMVMPAFAIGTGFAATVMRQTRSALLEVLDQDYIVTAKAKGLKGSVVIYGKLQIKMSVYSAVCTVIPANSNVWGRRYAKPSLPCLAWAEKLLMRL